MDPDARVAPVYANAWWGSLLEGKVDANGLVYGRNRYYDPAAGRFTQEDPIGIGGGLNVYGFAGEDSVNESDPFGLCPTPMAGGLGGLQCVLEDFVAGGKQALSRAEEAVVGGSARVQAYVRGGAGVFSTEAAITGDGRPSVRVVRMLCLK
jgi:RHS repeat-associated protein